MGSPFKIRVFSGPRDGYLDFAVIVGPWACRFNDPRMGGLFGNGSRWCSGWHNWRKDASCVNA